MSVPPGTALPSRWACLVVTLWLALASAGAAAQPDLLALPAAESAAGWETPARIAGFAIAAPGQRASVLLEPGPPGQLRLIVVDGTGTRHEVLVQRPNDAGGREDVLWLADSLMHDVGLRGRARIRPEPAPPPPAPRAVPVPEEPEPERAARVELGVVGGHLLGASLAVYPGRAFAVDAAAAVRAAGWHVHVGAVAYPLPLARGAGWELGWHVGAGVFVWNRHRLSIERPLTVGARLPVGLDLTLGGLPRVHLLVEGSPDLFRRARAVVAIELSAALRVGF